MMKWIAHAPEKKNQLKIPDRGCGGLGVEMPTNSFGELGKSF
jgi:hypothetical protein